MKDDIPSPSAEIDAFIRAAASMLPEKERICFDPFAREFLGNKFSRALSGKKFLKEIIRDIERKTPGGFACITGRTRYIDDYLKECLNAGIRQLVILGAGYDSRPYRFPEMGNRVKVFELDRSATQKLKIERILKTLGSIPSNVTYVAVDLNKDDIGDRLTRSGFDRTLKTLFILEGVTMYITPEAVDNILAFIGADAAKDSSVIFNYHRRFDHSVLPTMSKNARPLIATSLQKTPSGFFMEDNAIEKFLAQKGLKLVENVTGEFFKLVYFRGKNSQQPVCCRCGFIKAVVKAQ